MNNPGGLHVLVTRPRPDAVALAAELERRGHSVLQQPLLEIEIDANIPLDLDGAQALLFTSANGVRAFVARSGRRDLPVYAVGDATAGEARAQEFGAVESAGGAVEDLAALVRGKAEPEGGALLHVSGSAVAGDLSGLLTSDGFAVRREQLYTARTVTRIDAAVRAALSAGTLDAVLFFSPRSATAFANLVQAAEIGDACENLTAVCLSDAVAAALAPNSWRTVTVAARPNQESLIASLEGNVTDITNDQDRDGTDSPKGGPDLLDQGNAEAVVERFGGIRPMAAKLGVPVTTVQGWKGRNQIPAGRFVTIRAAANEHGVDLAAAADDVREDDGIHGIDRDGRNRAANRRCRRRICAAAVARRIGQCLGLGRAGTGRRGSGRGALRPVRANAAGDRTGNAAVRYFRPAGPTRIAATARRSAGAARQAGTAAR
jgi:uroporphyrinogen-III synthase